MGSGKMKRIFVYIMVFLVAFCSYSAQIVDELVVQNSIELPDGKELIGIATQSEVDSGIVSNKVVSPLTLENFGKWGNYLSNTSPVLLGNLDANGNMITNLNLIQSGAFTLLNSPFPINSSFVSVSGTDPVWVDSEGGLHDIVNASDLSGYVPYSGATNWLNLGANAITAQSGLFTEVQVQGDDVVVDTDRIYTSTVAKAASALQAETNTGDGSGLTNLVPTAVQGATVETLAYTSTNLVIPFDGYDVYRTTLTNAATITVSATETGKLSAVTLELFWQDGASQTWDTNSFDFVGGSAPEITSNAWNTLDLLWKPSEGKATVGLLP